jgi:hypothetical protein
MPVQVSARLTALAAAAKALADARKGGKAREARLDKALAKLDKAERPDLGAGLGGAGAPAAPAPAADVGEQQQELRDARAQPMDVVCRPHRTAACRWSPAKPH